MTHGTGTQPSPGEAIALLKEGNARFAAGQATHPHAGQNRLIETAEHGQHPFATIVACSDSRVPVELLFDCGVGDLFIIRVAGNVCATDEIGSIEYGAGHLGTPVVVVLAHTQCGAVTAVTTGAEMHGCIARLVEPIRPALAQAQAEHPGLEANALIPHVIEANMWQAIADLFKASPDVAGLAKTGKLQVVGAMYNIETGKVEFRGPHPRQAELLA